MCLKSNAMANDQFYFNTGENSRCIKSFIGTMCLARYSDAASSDQLVKMGWVKTQICTQTTVTSVCNQSSDPKSLMQRTKSMDFMTCLHRTQHFCVRANSEHGYPNLSANVAFKCKNYLNPKLGFGLYYMLLIWISKSWIWIILIIQCYVVWLNINIPQSLNS